MDSLTSPENLEWAKNFLGAAAQAELTQWLIVVGVIYQAVARKVASHFAAMESAVRSVTTELIQLRQEVTADLRIQRTRLDAVEQDVRQLKINTTKEN